MAAKKPGAQATVTLKHLAANLSEAHEMSKKQTEAVLGDLVGLVTKHLKGRPHPHWRPRHPGGAQARRPHGAQSGNRRTDPDQGQQESGLPRHQGTQRSGRNRRYLCLTTDDRRQTTEYSCVLRRL